MISHDVAGDLRRERLPVVAERTYVVENGTDHLSGDEAERVPRRAAGPGLGGTRLPASCSAPTTPTRTATWRSGSSRGSREQNPSLGLVLAGVAVAEGSSRVLEAIELRDTAGV